MIQLPDIDIANLRCSVLLIEPRTAFTDWLTSHLASELPPRRLEETYFPEENGVWVVPTVGAFGSDEAFREFVEAMKPKLLATEVQRFVDDVSKFPRPLSADSFDFYFDLRIRDALNDIRELWSKSCT